MSDELEPAAMARLLAAASEALAAARGSAVTLTAIETAFHYEGSPSTVVRATVEARSSARLPPRVAVKRANAGGVSWLHDVAGLELLGSSESARGLAPELLAVDAERRCVILEDLGPSRQRMLARVVLTSGDRARALDALLGHERTMARLHGATRGRGDALDALRSSWGASGMTRHRVNRLANLLQQFPRRAAELNVEVTPTAETELRAASAELADPGAFLCFTHGDPTLGNSFLTPEGVRLIDFETCGYRHALVDGSFARLRYLNSVFARRIPMELQRRLLDEYRRELAGWLPEAADDRLFSSGLLAACAAWMAALCSLLPRVAERDESWGRTTTRQRIVVGLEDFAALSEELDGMRSLARVASAMASRLRRRWPEEHCQMEGYKVLEPTRAQRPGKCQGRRQETP